MGGVGEGKATDEMGWRRVRGAEANYRAGVVGPPPHAKQGERNGGGGVSGAVLWAHHPTPNKGKGVWGVGWRGVSGAVRVGWRGEGVSRAGWVVPRQFPRPHARTALEYAARDFCRSAGSWYTPKNEAR